MNVAIVKVFNAPVCPKLCSGIGAILEILHVIAQSYCLPLPLKPGQPPLAGEQLLHGGLLDVAFFGNQALQRIQKFIYFLQCRRYSRLLLWARYR
ncbi:MAG: hypothetical protein ACK56I_12555, partial [bacterium]